MTQTITLGLMSGTSLDGVDVVACDFSAGLRLLGHHFLPFSDALRHDLLALTQAGDNEIERMGNAATELVNVYARATLELLDKLNLDRKNVLALGAHGQTIRHRPEKHWSMQLNNPALLAELTGLNVVADFRSRDLAAGGEGAPLVPAFHKALFEGNTPRAIVNIGGIANVTLLPSKQSRHVVTGFDCGPGNTLMDAWCQKIKGTTFDKDGAWARTGVVDSGLLKELLSHPYFSRRAPKSTGREEFNLAAFESRFTGISAENIQATLLELTAQSIAAAIQEAPYRVAETYLCGGGALNPYLTERLQKALDGKCRVASTQALGVQPMHVEAMAFAWLTMAFFEKKSGNLCAVTKAAGPRILGALYPH